jgi:hypothetical protein
MDPDTIELWKSIFALIAAVFTAVVAVLGWIKSRRAADSSRVAADQATTTNDTGPAIPQIFDPWKRFARTIIQVVLGFVTVAPLVPLIIAAIGAPEGSNVAVWLAAVGVWVSTVAGVISRVMAIPAVNSLLARINLDGHSGEVAAADNYTGYINTITPAAADAGH